MQIRESGENYLETILLLWQEKEVVRSIDVANALSYAKPSVSRAMSILEKAEYITIENDKTIRLTQKGRNKASEIYERHLLITGFLIQTLGVSQEVADKDACRIEHVISDEVFLKMKEFMEDGYSG